MFQAQNNDSLIFSIVPIAFLFLIVAAGFSFAYYFFETCQIFSQSRNMGPCAPGLGFFSPYCCFCFPIPATEHPQRNQIIQNSICTCLTCCSCCLENLNRRAYNTISNQQLVTSQQPSSSGWFSRILGGTAFNFSPTSESLRSDFSTVPNQTTSSTNPGSVPVVPISIQRENLPSQFFSQDPISSCVGKDSLAFLGIVIAVILIISLGFQVCCHLN